MLNQVACHVGAALVGVVLAIEHVRFTDVRVDARRLTIAVDGSLDQLTGRIDREEQLRGLDAVDETGGQSHQLAAIEGQAGSSPGGLIAATQTQRAVVAVAAVISEGGSGPFIEEVLGEESGLDQT